MTRQGKSNSPQRGNTMSTPDNDRYEVAIFNERVRKQVERGEHDKHLSDEWSENHYEEIFAVDESAVRAKLERRYPSKLGFVIARITKIPSFE